MPCLGCVTQQALADFCTNNILKLISSLYCAGSTVCFGFLFWFEELLTSCTTFWNVPICDILHKVKFQFLSPPSWMWALLLMKLKKETLRWPRGQDKITPRCVHLLGFVYGKQEEMPASTVVPGSWHQAWGTASSYTNTWCVLREDSSENDEVFKSSLFFPRGKIFVQLQTSTLFHKLSMFFPYIPSCEAQKQFGAEPAQYGLEINFKARSLMNKFLWFANIFSLYLLTHFTNIFLF